MVVKISCRQKVTPLNYSDKLLGAAPWYNGIWYSSVYLGKVVKMSSNKKRGKLSIFARIATALGVIGVAAAATSSRVRDKVGGIAKAPVGAVRNRINKKR